MDTLIRDVRYAIRRLRQNPVLTAAAMLSLALGIGANIAAFGLLYAVMLRSLPVRDPASLVVAVRTPSQQRSLSYPNYQYLRDHATSFDSVIAFRSTPFNIATGAATERLPGALVSGNYFEMLGVSMAVGTPIQSSDDLTPMSGGPRGPVAVISHRYWVQRMNGDRGVIGQPLRLNGLAMTIVGVAPEEFHGTHVGSLPDVYVPMMFAAHIFETPNTLTNPRDRWLRVMARLKPGVSPDQARSEGQELYRRFQETIAASSSSARRSTTPDRLTWEPGRAGVSEMARGVDTALYVLMGLVLLVWLLACVNVANLFVARAERYHRHTAIHIALGASGARLWAQNLVESLVLGVCGTVLALLAAGWMRSLLVGLLPANQNLDLNLAFDRWLIVLSIMLGLATSLVLGVITGWQRTRRTVTRALQGQDLHARLWLRKSLIVGQLALSLVVVMAAVLFGQTLRNLQRIQSGFEHEQVLVASVAPTGYKPPQQELFFDRLLDSVRSTPGVAAAALAMEPPLEGDTEWQTISQGPGSTSEPVDVPVSFISRDYFKTLGIRFVGGRDLGPRDETGGPTVVIVNQAFVARHLAKGAGVGTQIRANEMDLEIIGIVADNATNDLKEIDAPAMYVPVRRRGQLVLHVRAAGSPTATIATIEGLLRRSDPDVPLFNERTLTEQLDESMGRERTFATLSSAFGILALVLSAVGLYGIVAYAVSRRTKELGIRLALGAGRAGVIRQVLSEAAVLAVLGIIAGLPFAYAFGRAIGSMLYGVAPGDWWTLTLAAVILIAIALVAAWIPARQAARVDPLLALRYE
jgi:predicted permease